MYVRNVSREAPMPARNRTIPRTALGLMEAAESLGLSYDYFKAYVLPDLRLVRVESRRLVPVFELERWLEEKAERTLP